MYQKPCRDQAWGICIINLLDDRSKRTRPLQALVSYHVHNAWTGLFFTDDTERKRERTHYCIASSPVKTSEFLFANTFGAMLISPYPDCICARSSEYVFQINTFVPTNIMISILLYSHWWHGGLVVISFSDSSYMAKRRWIQWYHTNLHDW